MAVSSNSAINTQTKTIDGLSIRFAESEPRNSDALLLSPWPESLLAFDQMWEPLAEHTHLVAIDLPGYGHSEGREDVLAPRVMGEFLIRVADAFGLVNAEYLHERLAANKLDWLDAGHFVYEDRAEEYAALVTDWWNGGYGQV